MKRNRKKATLWNLVFHYYGIAFAIVWGILLVPLYLKFIPLHIYGFWLATGNIIAWLTAVDPGISDVMRQQVGKAYGAGETGKLNDYLISGTLLSFIVSLLVLLIGLLSANLIVGLLDITNTDDAIIVRNSFILSVIGGSLLIFSFGFISFCQGLLSSIGVGLVYVGATVSSLIVNVILLYKGYGLYSIPLSQIIRSVILIFGNLVYIIWRYLQESLIFGFSLRSFFILAKLSSYNFLGRIGSIVSRQIDSFLVARYLGAEVAPLLNLTKKGPELAGMIAERPVNAIQPALTNAWGRGETDAVRRNVSRLFLFILWVIGLLFAGFIVLNESFVSLWVGSNIYAGDKINLILCISMVATMIISIFSTLFFALGKILETSKAHFFQSIISILAQYAGVKFFGLAGLVSAQLISLLLFSAWYFPAKTITLIKFDSVLIHVLKREVLLVLIISLMTVLAFIKIDGAESWLRFLINLLLMVITYFIALYSVSRSFRKELHTILKHLRMLQ